jgi:hypothetical protein
MSLEGVSVNRDGPAEAEPAFTTKTPKAGV